ncbi:hypothetical protein [Leuconostoc mesenteroides]|uniref:hypothetical protein n=1 Tax=Leuconostoc mesenteroides TaxID=1245 RepID=UPI002072EE62|nr:hypothetical protein [Leuconostoc mesenteroides]MCM6831238.1 hypothetical protein [Leuconostoc mesenteroides]
MTEPVAYRVDGTIYNNINDAEFAVREIKHLRDMLEADNGLIRKLVYIEPLYTAEQLHPRVKMTQAEFDEFHDLFEKDFDLYSAITEISDTNLRTTLYDRLFTGTQKDKDRQNEFAVLWANYNPLEPEETIEIVLDKKWFVRSKKANSSGHYCFRSGVKHFGDYYYAKDKNDNKKAYPFDTKEEAEKWTNPLIEAVQLPVEEE